MRGYNLIFYVSSDPIFDDYVSERIKQMEGIKLLVIKEGLYPSLRVFDRYVSFSLSLNKARNKFYYNTLKTDNILKKVGEYSRRYKKKCYIRSASELNLSDDNDGFGYIQKIIPRRVKDKNIISPDFKKDDYEENKIVLRIVVLCIALLIGWSLYKKSVKNEAVVVPNKEIKELVDKYYGK